MLKYKQVLSLLLPTNVKRLEELSFYLHFLAIVKKKYIYMHNVYHEYRELEVFNIKIYRD